jgi:hypothetical protein
MAAAFFRLLPIAVSCSCAKSGRTPRVRASICQRADDVCDRLAEAGSSCPPRDVGRADRRGCHGGRSSPSRHDTTTTPRPRARHLPRRGRRRINRRPFQFSKAGTAQLSRPHPVCAGGRPRGSPPGGPGDGAQDGPKSHCVRPQLHAPPRGVGLLVTSCARVPLCG